MTLSPIIWIKTKLMKSACGEHAIELRRCMKKYSSCVQSGKKVSECLKEPNVLPDECVSYKLAYFECRRGILDARNRIRGQKGQRALS